MSASIAPAPAASPSSAAKLEFTPESQRRLLELMLISRHGDLRQESLNRQGKGHFHVSGMGHEALAALAMQMVDGDLSCLYYRDRAFHLARGVTNHQLALDYFAKRDSSTRGRQMPQHGSYSKQGLWSVSTPTGAQLLPACGMAWGMQLDGKTNFAVTTIGDAATREGDFFEAVCFAQERRLPVCFVVEDNGYGISTRTRRTNPLVIGALNAEAWRLVDGTRPAEVWRASAAAVEQLRAGLGPVLLWVRMDRLSSHTSSDDQKLYRPAEELSALEQNDPILRLRDEMIAAGRLSMDEFTTLDADIKERVRRDYSEAERAADADPSKLEEEILGPEPSLPADTGVLPAGKYRMGDTVNLTLRAALEKIPGTVLFGEDIEDPKGGVFRLTKGLSNDFPQQVFNSPLAESTILGVAAGLASYGKRPVFELQFIDFLPPAWNQLVTNWSTLRWRSYGDWKCPAVLYAPCGAYLPGGSIWHSQTNEAVIAHQPGIRLVMPATAGDAAGLMWTSMHAEDPTIILLPKHLMWAEQNHEKALAPVPFGKARRMASGDDVTIVAWGNTVEVAADALKLLGDGVRVDLWDLRSLVPWDREAITESVKRTGRLVVVQEDTENCSVGQMIITTLIGDPAVWSAMCAPPALISKGNVLIGYSPLLEFASLPDAKRVAAAVQAVMRGEAKPAAPTFQPQEAKAALAAAPSPALEAIEKASEEKPAEVSEPSTDKPAAPAGDQSTSGEITLRVPVLGEGIRAARIVALLKQPGDAIKPDDPLCELETDKAVYPVEAAGAGVMREWLVAIGDQVEIDSALGTIQTDDALAWGRHFAVNSGDVTPALPAAPRVPTGPQPALSSAITKRLVGVVPVTCAVTAKFDAVRAARRAAKGKGESGVTPSLIAAWCVVQAIKGHASFRRQFLDDGTIRQREEFDLGLAVALDGDRLVTAVIPNADRLAWPDFLSAYASTVAEARGGRLHERIDAPVILTSLGGFGVRTGSPILVPPAVGTLFLGEAHYEMQAEADGGWPAPAEVVTLSLTFDHRVVNGAGAGAFVQDVRRRLENFRAPV